MRIQVGFICVLVMLFGVDGFLRRKRWTPEPDLKPDDYEEKYKLYTFQQIQDHFDDSNDVHWTQRYWSNDEFATPDSPIFLMLGGEAEANPYILQSSEWYPLAKKYKAMLYLLEHRFYGDSHPTPEATTENLKYLSSQQAMADIAYFIEEINKNNSYTEKNKWILFGGSYPGMLVAWFKLHYPDHVYGGVSSSPALMPILDYSEYNDVVRTSIEKISPGCSTPIHEAVKTMQNMLNDKEKSHELLEKFNVCQDDYSDWKDQALMIVSITNELAENVQYYHQQNHMKIEYACRRYFMNETLGDPVWRLASYTRRGERNGKIVPCGSYRYQNDVFSIAWFSSWNSPSVESGNKQWSYQMCSELGLFSTSGTEDAFFSDSAPLKYYMTQCGDYFQHEITQNDLENNINALNQRNQGMDINVTNVIFLQGEYDPWHVQGVVNNPTEDSPYIFINGSSHCQDMAQPDDSDTPELKAARKQIETFLDRLLEG